MVLPFVLLLLRAEIAGTIRCAAKVPQDRLNDALAGMAVAVGVDGLAHFGVGGFAVQQLIRLSQNGLRSTPTSSPCPRRWLRAVRSRGA